MSESSERTGGRGFGLALGVIAAALAVLVVLLAVQNLQLKRRLADAGAAQRPEPAFAPGETIGPLSVVDDRGETLTLLDGATGRPTLLLVFTSTCPACRATFPIWRDVAARAAATGTDVVGVRLDAGPGEDPASALPPEIVFPVYAPDHDAPGAMRRVRSVPATVLLDASGTVAAIWSGTLDEGAVRELERELDARSASSRYAPSQGSVCDGSHRSGQGSQASPMRSPSPSV